MCFARAQTDIKLQHDHTNGPDNKHVLDVQQQRRTVKTMHNIKKTSRDGGEKKSRGETMRETFSQ